MCDEESDKDVDIADATATGDFTFAAFQCTSRTEGGNITEPEQVEIPKHLEKHCTEARLKLQGEGDTSATKTPFKANQKWCEDNRWAEDMRDAQKRRPGDKGYDKTTHYVPKEEFAKLTQYAQQYWKIKSKNYDVVILFRKSKSYEVLHDDADICQPLFGLPWIAPGPNQSTAMRYISLKSTYFEKHASRLIKLGYKVGRVEQTESMQDLRFFQYLLNFLLVCFS